MRKKRSIVYVRPGKDVTLYVPAETPPEVIHYLNQLKEDGTFSQGVMEIVTEYVMKQTVHSNVVTPANEEISDFPSDSDDYLGARDHRESLLAHLDENNSLLDISSTSVPETSNAKADESHQKLDLAQIFRQAQRNAGKMNLD